MNKLIIFALSLAFVACGQGKKSDVTVNGDGVKLEDVTDRSVCGAATSNSAPLAGTSWSQTLQLSGKVKVTRSLSFTGSTLTIRQKATDLVTRVSASIKATVYPKGNTFDAKDLGHDSATLTLHDGQSLKINFDTTSGLISYTRQGACLTTVNGDETIIFVPEL